MAGADFEAEVRAALREGAALFNRGRFTECHEVLEGVWLRDRTPRRRFLQGLIMVAAGYHHLTKGNYVGMEHLLTAGRDLLLPFGATYMGVDLEPIVRAAARDAEWAQHAKAAAKKPRPPVPPTFEVREKDQG